MVGAGVARRELEAELEGLPGSLQSAVRGALDGCGASVADDALSAAAVGAARGWREDQHARAAGGEGVRLGNGLWPAAVLSAPFSADYDRAGAPHYRTPFAEVRAPGWLDPWGVSIVGAIYARWWRQERERRAGGAGGPDEDPEFVRFGGSWLVAATTSHGAPGAAGRLRQVLRELAGTPITAQVATGPRGERVGALGLDGVSLLEDWELLVPDAGGELWLSADELDRQPGGWRSRQRLGRQPLTMRARVPRAIATELLEGQPIWGSLDALAWLRPGDYLALLALLWRAPRLSEHFAAPELPAHALLDDGRPRGVLVKAFEAGAALYRMLGIHDTDTRAPRAAAVGEPAADQLHPAAAGRAARVRAADAATPGGRRRMIGVAYEREAPALPIPAVLEGQAAARRIWWIGEGLRRAARRLLATPAPPPASAPAAAASAPAADEPARAVARPRAPPLAGELVGAFGAP